MQCQDARAWNWRRLPVIPAYVLEAHHQLWGVNFYLGDYKASETYASHGMAIYDYERHRHLAWGYTGHDPGVCCRSFCAQMLCIRGKPDQSDPAVARSRRTGRAQFASARAWPRRRWPSASST